MIRYFCAFARVLELKGENGRWSEGKKIFRKENISVWGQCHPSGMDYIFGVNGGLNNEKKENKTKNNIRQINGSFVERVASYQ